MPPLTLVSNAEIYAVINEVGIVDLHPGCMEELIDSIVKAQTRDGIRLNVRMLVRLLISSSLSGSLRLPYDPRDASKLTSFASDIRYKLYTATLRHFKARPLSRSEWNSTGSLHEPANKRVSAASRWRHLTEKHHRINDPVSLYDTPIVWRINDLQPDCMVGLARGSHYTVIAPSSLVKKPGTWSIV